MNTTNCSYSEEAFLLNSLHEVVKVWASGSGKADFQLKIDNGTAEPELQKVVEPGNQVPRKYIGLQKVFGPQKRNHHCNHVCRTVLQYLCYIKLILCFCRQRFQYKCNFVANCILQNHYVSAEYDFW
jgi:hypothetical protein